MKMIHVHWTQRIRAYVVLFCLVLSSAGFNLQPVQAASTGTYWLFVNFMTVERQSVCQGEKFKIEPYFSVRSRSDLAPIAPYGNATITPRAQLGKIEPGKGGLYNIWFGKVYTYEFDYTAPKDKEGTETITASVVVNGGKYFPTLKEKATFSFKVIACEFKLHGTADMTMVNGKQLEIMGWEPVGTYDIAGSFKIDKNGNLTGQATATTFVDVHFTGKNMPADEGITCHHTTPWEGFTSVKIEADPTEWQLEGKLVLKLTIEPMGINASQVICEGPDDGYGHSESPSVTIPSFTLNFDPLPASGGSTSREFQFPSGQGSFKMDLTVTKVK